MPQRAPAQRAESAQQNLATAAAAEFEAEPYAGRGDARAGREIPPPCQSWQHPAKQTAPPTAFAQVAARDAEIG